MIIYLKEVTDDMLIFISFQQEVIIAKQLYHIIHKEIYIKIIIEKGET